MVFNSTSPETPDHESRSESNKKTALILIPGFRSTHLSCSIWDQLQKDNNLKCSTSRNPYNIITNNSFTSKKTLHVYELNWSELTYPDKNLVNQFYQAFLSIKVFLNSIIILLKIIFTIFLKVLIQKNEEYSQYAKSVLFAFVLPIQFIFVPVVSLYLISVNLFIFCSLINVFLDGFYQGNNFAIIRNFKHITTLFIGFLDYIFHQLSQILPQINIITLPTNEEILSFLLLFIWIIGIGYSSAIRKGLELYDFANKYCRNEILRRQIRQELLMTVNSILLETSYEDIVIISYSFGVLLAIDLLAHIDSPKNIKHVSVGNIIGAMGLMHFRFINRIVKYNLKNYHWTDYYSWFDFVATKVPTLKRNNSRFIQEQVGYPAKSILSLFYKANFHFVYFLEKAFVIKHSSEDKTTSPFQHILGKLLI